MPTMPKPIKRPWHSNSNESNTPTKKDNFYSNQPWRKLRFRKLIDSPLCEISNKKGIIKEATMVDHIRPRRLFPELELDYNNLQSLSHNEHQVKRAKEKNIKTRHEFESLALKEGWIT